MIFHEHHIKKYAFYYKLVVRRSNTLLYTSSTLLYTILSPHIFEVVACFHTFQGLTWTTWWHGLLTSSVWRKLPAAPMAGCQWPKPHAPQKWTQHAGNFPKRGDIRGPLFSLAISKFRYSRKTLLVIIYEFKTKLSYFVFKLKIF